MSLLPSVIAGCPPMNTLGDGISHVPAGTGTQGIGVRTPNAAAVALATVGFARLLHIPKVGMLTIGAMSVMTPAGQLAVRTQGVGRALNGAGAAPKGHCKIAPVQRQKLIGFQSPFPFCWYGSPRPEPAGHAECGC